MDRRALLRRGGLVAALGLAGCAGSPDQTDTQADEATASPTDSPTPTDASDDDGATATETETNTATDTPSPTPPTNPQQRVVVGPNGKLRFDPESFTVSTGDTVLWEWASGGHNVSPTNQPSGADWPGKDEEFSYTSGTAHWYTFEEAGEYRYVCEPHQSTGMRGSFTVE